MINYERDELLTPFAKKLLRDYYMLDSEQSPQEAFARAATSDGDYFSVPSATSDEFLILYRNDAGVATEIDSYPNADAVRKRVIFVPDIAELRALEGLVDGQVIETMGYFSAGDYGGNSYQVVANNSQIVDLGEFIPLQDPTLLAKGMFLAGYPCPRQFGVVGDGAADDTEALRSFHNYCNANYVPAVYRGIHGLGVNVDAQINITTDADFLGVPIRALGDQYPSGGGYGDPVNTMFTVDDPDTPEVSIVQNYPSGISKRDFKFMRGVIPESGFVLLTSDATEIPGRAPGDAPLPYIQSFHVIRERDPMHGLSWDIEAGDVDFIYRKNPPRGRITIKNITLIQDGNWHRQLLLRVSRNKVTVKDLSIPFESEPVESSVHQLITAKNCSEFEFDGFSDKSMPSSAGGTYVLLLSGVATANIRNVHTFYGWGWIGSNYINGVTVEHCTINRMDGHASAHNITVSDVTFTDEGSGVTIGWGGGSVKMRDITLYNSPAYKSRGDYGSWFSGDISIDGVTVEDARSSNNVRIIDLSNTGRTGYVLPVAESVQLTNVTYTSRAIQNLSNATPVVIRKAADGQYIFPYYLNISNLDARGQLDLLLDIGWLESYSDGVKAHRYFIENIWAKTCVIDFYATPDFSSAESPEISGIISDVYCESDPGLKVLGRYYYGELEVSCINRLSELTFVDDIFRQKGSRVNIRDSTLCNSLLSGHEYIGSAAAGRTNSETDYNNTGPHSYAYNPDEINRFRIFNCDIKGRFSVQGTDSITGVSVLAGSDVLKPTGVTDADIWDGWNRALS